MSGDYSIFKSLTKTNGGFVIFGDNSKVHIVGIGEVGTPYTNFIKKVIYVNGLQNNPLSISQLWDEGHNVKFEHDRCYVSSSGFEPIFTTHREINVYFTDFSVIDKTKCKLFSCNRIWCLALA